MEASVLPALRGNMAFEQIKPYVTGDDPRTVNWKATAKYNHLMVNTYTEERSQQIYCLVDKDARCNRLLITYDDAGSCDKYGLNFVEYYIEKRDRAGDHVLE